MNLKIKKSSNVMHFTIHLPSIEYFWKHNYLTIFKKSKNK